MQFFFLLLPICHMSKQTIASVRSSSENVCVSVFWHCRLSNWKRLRTGRHDGMAAVECEAHRFELSRNLYVFGKENSYSFRSMDSGPLFLAFSIFFSFFFFFLFFSSSVFSYFFFLPSPSFPPFFLPSIFSISFPFYLSFSVFRQLYYLSKYLEFQFIWSNRILIFPPSKKKASLWSRWLSWDCINMIK